LRHIQPGEEDMSIMENLRKRINNPERITQSILSVYGEYLRQKI